MKVVIDTNVFVAALRSKRGTAFRLLQQLQQERFTFALSVPLFLEYEDVLKRPAMVPLPKGVSKAERVDFGHDKVSSLPEREAPE